MNTKKPQARCGADEQKSSFTKDGFINVRTYAFIERYLDTLPNKSDYVTKLVLADMAAKGCIRIDAEALTA